MSSSKFSPQPDPTAALRQQRRRDRLKELQVKKVIAVFNKDQIIRLDYLVGSGYAPDRSTALVKGMDEAFERLDKAYIRDPDGAKK